MKQKFTALFTAIALVFMFSACQNEEEPKAEEKPYDVEVPATVSESNASTPTEADGKTVAVAVIGEMSSAVALSLEGTSTEEPSVSVVSSARSVTMADMDAISTEFENTFNKFLQDLGNVDESTGKANATLSFNKTPGDITDVPSYMKMSIPALRVNANVAMEPDAASLTSDNVMLNISGSGSGELSLKIAADMESLPESLKPSAENMVTKSFSLMAGGNARASLAGKMPADGVTISSSSSDSTGTVTEEYISVDEILSMVESASGKAGVSLENKVVFMGKFGEGEGTEYKGIVNVSLSASANIADKTALGELLTVIFAMSENTESESLTQEQLASLSDAAELDVNLSVRVSDITESNTIYSFEGKSLEAIIEFFEAN